MPREGDTRQAGDVATGAGRRRRVALVAPSLGILGGQAIAAQRLMARFADCPELDVRFIPVNPVLPRGLAWLQRIKYVRTVVTSIRYIAELLVQVPRVDVLHVFSASYWSFLLAPAPAILVGRCFRRRVIVNYRSGEADDHLTRWGWHARPILQLADQVITPSGYLRDVFARHGIRAAVISNFVELEAIPYRRREHLRPVLLANRNLEELYGVDVLLRAFRIVQDSYPGATLTLAGDGSERSRLEAMARDLRLRRVTFLGQVRPDTMPALCDQADIYVNASRIDNMPQSIVEAFAAGLPVVTTDAGGIPYIATHESTALLVPVDDASGLAASVMRLLTDPGLATKLADAARSECLERYRWDAVERAWKAAYGAGVAAAPSPSTAARQLVT